MLKRNSCTLDFHNWINVKARSTWLLQETQNTDDCSQGKELMKILYRIFYTKLSLILPKINRLGIIALYRHLQSKSVFQRSIINSAMAKFHIARIGLTETILSMLPLCSKTYRRYISAVGWNLVSLCWSSHKVIFILLAISWKGHLVKFLISVNFI